MHDEKNARLFRGMLLTAVLSECERLQKIMDQIQSKLVVDHAESIVREAQQ